jgi:acyl-coenzyme A synthetase/AMP-(fatty) acid ligase
MFPIRLAEWIDRHQVSVWYSVPSVLSMMVLHGQLRQHRFERLRMILFAGEVFPVKFLRELMEMVPGREYFNLYGPTETNVITYYQVPPIPPEQSAPIPIGKCCENTDVFALTEDGARVTQPGEEGELMARGSCVAQGYWGDDAKTLQRFVRNTSQTDFGEIMYKTGDVVSIDTNGNYIYIGRKDDMIKSRGYRIELGDIEAALYSHAEIEEAAVVAVPDEVVGNRIRAIIVLGTAGQLTHSDIRHWCAEMLPKYMVPDIIEFRDKLPKTSTGKVDKAKLARESQ